jgi:hypothetical protein
MPRVDVTALLDPDGTPNESRPDTVAGALVGGAGRVMSA